ncbi:hypothetical protein PV797_07660 [Clostridiaceae bacterium M8S5]|nr:hypothetical protein PV797_07660 [Clostridiaceae bacterium M8S5]
MNNLTLSEKFTLLAMNEKRKINYFLGLQNGIYVSSLLELFMEKIVINYDSVKIASVLPATHSEVRSMYEFIQENENERLDKIMKRFVGPFRSQSRKKLKSDVIDSVNKKVFDSDNSNEHDDIVKEIIENIHKQFSKTNDVESVVLAKLLIEFKIAKRYFDKDKRKELKSLLKNESTFSSEIKEIMKVIDSLAVVGALAGAGVV